MKKQLNSLYSQAIVIVLLLIIPLAAAAKTSDSSAENAYQFGVFPYLPGSELKKIFTPFVSSISKA